MAETKTMPVGDVRYEADLYPRFEPRDSVVRQYADQIDALPPIEVNQDDILIDGWHRWTAHKLAERETIKVRVVETETKAELLALAVERNAKHGIQLTGDEKRAYAVRIWSAAPVAERAAVEKRLQKTLSVGKTFIREALGDVKRARREENHRNAACMWLACHSNRAIGEAVGIDEGTVRRFAADGKIPQCLGWETHPDFDEEGFKPPYCNVWTPKTSPFKDHVDALLWFCTDPGDVVIDPFAGSTPTIDACKRRFRRYFVSDPAPPPDREHEVRRHDPADGPLAPPNWKDVALVYLAPFGAPRVGGALMPPEGSEAFQKRIADIINAYGDGKRLRSGARVALAIQPTQWDNPDNRKFIHHIVGILRLVSDKYRLIQRIQTPADVDRIDNEMRGWAIENRDTIACDAEIAVWRKG